MAQATKANRKTLLNSAKSLEIGTYFVSGLNLYYVAGYEPVRDLILVEDCYENKKKWMPVETLARTRREVIEPK